MIPDLPGLDIHNGLRISWDDLTPTFSASAPEATVDTDVRAYIVMTQTRLEYAKRWLAARGARSAGARPTDGGGT